MTGIYTFTSDAISEIDDFICAVKDAVDEFSDRLEDLPQGTAAYRVKPFDMITLENYSTDGSYASYLEAAAACRANFARLTADMGRYLAQEKRQTEQQAVAYTGSLFAALTGYAAEFSRLYDSCLAQNCTDPQAIAYLREAKRELALPFDQLKAFSGQEQAAALSAMNFVRLAYLDVCTLYLDCEIGDDDGEYYFDLTDAYDSLTTDVCDNFIELANEFADLFVQDTIERAEPLLEALQAMLDDILFNAEYFEA